MSSIGDFIYAVTIVVYLIEETDSAGWVAASFITRMAVYSACGPIGGVLADRFDRRRLMMTLDIARAALMLAVLAVVAADGPPLATLALVTVAAALGTIYRPAAVSATPLLVPEDDLAAANAAEATVYHSTSPGSSGLPLAERSSPWPARRPRSPSTRRCSPCPRCSWHASATSGAGGTTDGTSTGAESSTDYATASPPTDRCPA